MNKQTLINKVKAAVRLFELSEYEVGAGGHLLLLGLREETGDIDMSLTETEFYRLVEENNLAITEIDSGSFLLAPLTEDIDIHIKQSEISDNVVCGINCSTEQETLDLKVGLNRDKDQEDILKLKAFMGVSDA